MSHVIAVDIASLHAVATRIEAAGRALAKLPAPAADTGFAALERTATAWIGYLTNVGSAITSTGADLHAVAETYGRAEDAARDELRRWTQ